MRAGVLLCWRPPPKTSSLKSEFFFESAFPQRTTAGYTPGFTNVPVASQAASWGSRPAFTQGFELGRAQTPFGWVPGPARYCDSKMPKNERKKRYRR